MGNLSIFGLNFGAEPKTEIPQPVVRRVDAEFVQVDDRPIVDTIFTCSIIQPYIAGGACLAWYQHQSVATDIDLYFYSPMQFERFKEDFERSKFFTHGCYTIKTNTNNALTYGVTDYDTGKNWAVQLIKKDWYSTVEDVLDKFDITVCKIGYDGKRVVTRSTFIDDVATRTLRFDNINPMSHKRLVKYMAYGYEPTLGEIERLVNDENIDWETKGTDHYA